MDLKNSYDLFQMEGDMEKESEMRSNMKDLLAKRPVIHKLEDHDTQIRAKEPMEETSEYRSTINKFQVETLSLGCMLTIG